MLTTMKKLHNNQSGAAVLVILLIIVIGLVGVAGWLVYKNQKKTPATNTATSATTSQKSAGTSTPAADPYTGWQTITTKDKLVAVKSPASWLYKICDDNIKTVYIAPNQQELATCSSGNGGRISVGYSDAVSAATRTQMTTKSECDKEFSVTEPTVNGVKGYRVTRINGPVGDSVCQGLEGTKYVTYFFDKGANTYTFTYQQTPSASDELASFDLLVKSATF